MTVSITNLRRSAAASYIKSKLSYGSTAYFAKLATVGGGPSMVYASRFPLYPVEALDKWIADQLSAPVASTSQLSKKEAGHD